MPNKYKPLPGYTYQGRNGESNGPRMLIGTLVTLGFAIVAVVLRMTVRWSMVHSTGWEDYFAVIALVLAIARSVMLSLSEYRERRHDKLVTECFAVTTRYQFGQHIWDIDKANFGYVYTVSLRSHE